MANTDYYDLLGVAHDCGEEELKRAYRRLARELHPDTNPDPAAEERFKEVTLAYETLRDPERRRRYDMFGPDAVRGTGATAGGGDPFAGFGATGFGDIFDAFFGGGTTRARTGPVRGNDLEINLELDFAEAVFGAPREVNLRAPSTCETCAGSGASPGTTPTRCSQCGGSGELRRMRQSILGQMVTSSPCPRCGGLGQEITSPCGDCRGEGRRTESKTYVVEVPAGVDDGTSLRLTSKGAAGPRGGPPGDLYVHLRVRPSDRFTRSGYDLVHQLHIPFTSAALGVHLPFETMDGSEDLVVPPGTQTGKLLRLRGRGVPHVDGRARGDLIVQVAVDTPADLSPAQEALLRQLAEDRGEAVAPPDQGFFARIKHVPVAVRGSEVRLAAAHVFVETLEDEGLVLDEEDRHHLERALRLRPGEVVTASDGAGGWRRCRWTAGSELEVDGPVAREPASEPPIAVGFVVPKGDRPEWIAQKLTELGADRILPLTSTRSVVRWDDAAARRRVARLRAVVKAAAMQSRRLWLPEVDDLQPVADLLARPRASCVLAEPGGAPPALDGRAVLVGPEGGWTADELANHDLVSLGSTILRAETAALSACVLLGALRAGIVSTRPPARKKAGVR